MSDGQEEPGLDISLNLLVIRSMDSERAVADIQATGARIVSSPKDSPWGRRAVAEDPDGHRVELTERL